MGFKRVGPRGKAGAPMLGNRNSIREKHDEEEQSFLTGEPGEASLS